VYSGYPKIRTYNRCFTMEPREESTGFETIMDLDSKYRPMLEKQYGKDYCAVPVSEMIKQLCPIDLLERNTIPRTWGNK
jgi:hypothetical protein